MKRQNDEDAMATKTSSKKTKKPVVKTAPAKPKTVKAHAKAATAKGAAVKKKLAPKPAAKAAKVATPATKAQPPVKKTEAKKPESIKDTKAIDTKTLAKAAEAVAAKAVVAVKKTDGKVVPGKAGAKGPGEPGEGAQPDADSPLLDMSDVGVRKMITRAKQRGYVTYDELNKVLPSDKVSSEQIEDTMSMLNEMGINVIESEEQDEQAEVPALAQGKQVVAKSGEEEEQYDRTDDPVRMYLREMGSVELLSREGEIAIAKRIEAGRELMIGALCESPLTFEALTVWRDELNEGKVLLRDIIDLEAMYGGGPDAQSAPSPAVPPVVQFAPPGAPAQPVLVNGHAAPAMAEPVRTEPVPQPAEDAAEAP